MSLSSAYSQLPAKNITESMYLPQRDQLAADYGVNKTWPKDFELATLIALSKYPELKGLRLDIRYRKIKTTMEARPTVLSVFRRKAKRRYVVVINSKEGKLGKASLKNVPFNAQIGVLAHEFAHIRMYNTKNVFGLIGIAISYSISKKYREKFEKENDRETISRGYGWQVYHFTHYILNETDVSEKYKKYKRRIYYEPKELEEIIEGSSR
ncbi:MAG: hypothetical protein JKX73_02740 [Flavobacteriales bacterium]|nr:hypothetical protein [Flavobacteriales bacterium]